MKQKLNLELRASEGGEDSKLLIQDMLNIYIKACKNNSLEYKILDETNAYISIWISGNNAKTIFKNESGSHRWQRVPPTERKGRIQTSTITVAILEPTDYKEVDININDIRIETTRGSGAGGQHKNVTDSCVIITHYPTGIKVVRDGRKQHQNKEEALKELKKRINEFYRTGYISNEVEERREQIGDGSRSDKRRTYRVKYGIVIDHITNKSASYKDISKGKIELLA